jgi:hypothetical protein
MIHTDRYSVAFYQNLGKLFYAIAAIDKHVHEIEFEKLNELIKEEWLSIDEFEDDYKTDASHQIEIVFDWLRNREKVNPNKLFDNFIEYKKKHESQFTDNYKKLIIKTANAIANSFSGKNKSELIMLAKLEINLK